MKTKINKIEANKEVRVIDASGRTLGRLATEVAVSLMGKDKPMFQRNSYSGAPVKVVNAGKIKITNKKLSELYHTRYSGIPGGLKVMTGHYTLEKKGMKELVRLATYNMLPGNKLRREMMKNLTIEE